jgi:hypothetical protein
MGSFVFKWEHAASEVYVTGTFDDWSKSEKLIQTGNVFEKNVTLPSAAEKIYYKVRKVKRRVQTSPRSSNFCFKRFKKWSSIPPPAAAVGHEGLRTLPSKMRHSGMRQDFIWRSRARTLASFFRV